MVGNFTCGSSVLKWNIMDHFEIFQKTSVSKFSIILPASLEFIKQIKSQKLLSESYQNVFFKQGEINSN